jgi:anthranilate phosphoribosyltransferase
MPFLPYLHRVAQRENLSAGDAQAAMDAILAGEATHPQIAGFLVAMAMKGETVDELVGFARAMRARAVPIDHGLNGAPLVDTCGTGGDGSGTFNISTLVAFVVAGAGVRVAKHGNRSASSLCGSADLLESMGIDIAMPPEECARAIREIGIGFLFAPAIHTAMKHAHPVRVELKMRTVFNLLGPLTNPAGAARQIVGVPRSELTEPIARSLMLLGSARAWVVHGADGIDEISTTGYTKVSECRDGAVNTFYIHPSDFGVSKAAPEALRGGDAEQNAAIIREVLDGRSGAHRDVVALNAGAALFIAGKAISVADGIRVASTAIDSGAARATLAAMAKVSNAEVVA